MKRRLFVLMVMALSLLTVSPVLAHEDMGCAHDATTIASLRECVLHARDMGHIDSECVAQRLLKKLDKAQANLDRGKVDDAIDKLEDFVEVVEDQSGEHIDPMHAEHLVHHAHMVIMALDDRGSIVQTTRSRHRTEVAVPCGHESLPGRNVRA